LTLDGLAEVRNQHSLLDELKQARDSLLEELKQTRDSLLEELKQTRADSEAHLAALRLAEERAAYAELLAAKLQGDKVRHEVPRLGRNAQTPLACDVRDAVGLLRIVESQASDLVRLRRALQSSHTLAAQRLELVHAEARAWVHPCVGETGKIADWLRSTMLADIRRMQDAVTDVVDLSRWRRMGQRLGLAKRLPWEAGGVHTTLAEDSSGATTSADAPAEDPSMAELVVELERLNGMLDQMRLSRWRKLGHWLGLAKRLPWESGTWRNPLLLKALPPQEVEPPSAPKVRTAASHSTYTGFIDYTNERFLEECRSFAIDVIFDIGANVGQFAQGIRFAGYRGQIISFEPLSSAHATLVETATPDPLWDVADRCAVGASENQADINIAGNSYSSSLLPMLDLHREAAPQSEYQGTERCQVITIDRYIEQTFSDPTTLFGLKMDTQGYEAQVLEGLRRNHDRVKVIVCEMSLSPLYSHGPSMPELCHLLAEMGYRCVALGPEFEDPRTGELLQANGVFVKRS
jgi:FkbM family methyltransferase